jgi:hypothetical protein
MTQTRLLGALRNAQAVGSYERRFQALAKVPLLIIDLCVACGYVEFPSGRCLGAGLGQEFVNITSSWE